MSLRAALLLACLPLAACGPDLAFDRAAARERRGALAEAADRFGAFAAKYPAHAKAPEAMVRAARIYTYVFQRCPEAVPLLEKTAREHSDTPWAEEARRALLDCPEYFPMRARANWIFVDSQTGGKNMRLEIVVSSASAAAADMRGAFYAGTQRFQDYKKRYVKEGWAVWEEDGKDRVPILRYPYREGNAWSAKRGGRRVEFRIETAQATVSTKAGTYRSCLKVKESQPGVPAWKYDYYAPGVGRVKTTIGGKGFENPNTELREAKVPEPAAPGGGT
ncbi:MAG: hypothetical protein HY925_05970 [Elusimicrobia bacterium]|nr:hypothetical protein [Elusimicrobiota bacterium]